MKDRMLLGVFVSVVLLPMGRFAGAAEPESPPPIEAFCIDFNWGPQGINGFADPGVWADASPEEHVGWYEGLGANVIQTFAVSCNGYAKWQNGPGQDAARFPIAVWLQDLRNVSRCRAIGINLYVALWEGPTAEQIADLKRHRMPVICDQNDYALKHLDEKTIVGWMHGDEPDNAQSLPNGKGYGPPILPEKIAAACRKIKDNGLR